MLARANRDAKRRRYNNPRSYKPVFTPETRFYNKDFNHNALGGSIYDQSITDITAGDGSQQRSGRKVTLRTIELHLWGSGGGSGASTGIAPFRVIFYVPKTFGTQISFSGFANRFGGIENDKFWILQDKFVTLMSGAGNDGYINSRWNQTLKLEFDGLDADDGVKNQVRFAIIPLLTTGTGSVYRGHTKVWFIDN